VENWEVSHKFKRGRSKLTCCLIDRSQVNSQIEGDEGDDESTGKGQNLSEMDSMVLSSKIIDF
jgi:hypothetical protein